MDLNLIKNRLESFQKKDKKEKKDAKKYFWRPPIGKAVVRIVPSKENPKYPFKEVFFHYIGKYPTYSLINFGEKDPISEFCDKLKKSGDKENWKLSRKIEPKMRIFAQVIVRGEEDKGVRLWEFGKEIYNELLRLADDEDIGDFTSITDGRDLTVETVGKEVTGNYNKSSVRVKPKISALTEDKEQLEKWLKDQPEILKIYDKPSYDDVKNILYEYLNPEPSSEGEEEEEEAEVNVTVSSSIKEEGVKKTPASRFDDLFEK